jgi:hypothetical protein
MATKIRAGRAEQEQAAAGQKLATDGLTRKQFIGFQNEKAILEKVPVCRRTLSEWKRNGIIPYIKAGSRCLYDWESVRAALLRLERNSPSNVHRVQPAGAE